MKKNLSISFAVLITLTMILSACLPVKEARSTVERVTAPDVPAGEGTALVAGNTAFGFDLYQALRSSEGNLVYSPYSISLALAMAYGGSRGETASQMAAVLHFTLPVDQFHTAFNALDLDLSARPGQAAGVEEEDRFELTIANALWGQEDWPFLPEYLDLLAANYGAGLRLLDFRNASESARKQINAWVSDQTHDRIQDLLPPGVLDASTRLALVNAIYFKATWEQQFDPYETSDAQFKLRNGDPVTVKMMGMRRGETFPYASGDGWQAVALPYRGGLTDMVIILPDVGTMETFEAALDAERYAGIIASLEQQNVLVRMPKFSFETSLGLSEMLIQMGMSAAFDASLADFSGMDGARDLNIGAALHKAFIAVDEKGTEAAAATAVIMMETSLPVGGINLTIDRPFLYFIRDVPTDTLLFMGRVDDPR